MNMDHPKIRRVVTGHDEQGKAIVKIDLVEEQPTSLWMNAAPNDSPAFTGRPPISSIMQM